MILQRLVSSTGKYVRPQPDDQRVLEKYLFFPKYIRGECRWLERVRIRQIYTNVGCQYSWQHHWLDINFVEIPKSNEQSSNSKSS